MGRVFGKELVKEIEAALDRSNEVNNRLQENLDNFEVDLTDCFLSKNVAEASVSLHLKQLKILEGTGTGKFVRLQDKDTKKTYKINHVETPWGYKYVIEGFTKEDGRPVFISNTSPRTLKKYNLEEIFVDRPVWLKLGGDSFGHAFPYEYEAQWNRVTGEDSIDL